MKRVLVLVALISIACCSLASTGCKKLTDRLQFSGFSFMKDPSEIFVDRADEKQAP